MFLYQLLEAYLCNHFPHGIFRKYHVFSNHCFIKTSVSREIAIYNRTQMISLEVEVDFFFCCSNFGAEKRDAPFAVGRVREMGPSGWRPVRAAVG